MPSRMHLDLKKLNALLWKLDETDGKLGSLYKAERERFGRAGRSLRLLHLRDRIVTAIAVEANRIAEWIS